MCSVAVFIVVLISFAQVYIFTMTSTEVSEQDLASRSNDSKGDPEAPFVKQAEHLIANTANNLASQSSDPIGDIIELIQGLIKTIVQFVTSPGGSASEASKYSVVAADTKVMMSNVTKQCVSDEKSKIDILVTESSASIHTCFTNTSSDVQSVIPEVITLIVEVAQTLKNITEDIASCIKNNPFFLGLPACLNGVTKYAQAEYESITQQINSTIINNLETIEKLANETEVCVTQSTTKFNKELDEILSSFAQCVTG